MISCDLLNFSNAYLLLLQCLFFFGLVVLNKFHLSWIITGYILTFQVASDILTHTYIKHLVVNTSSLLFNVVFIVYIMLNVNLNKFIGEVKKNDFVQA